jgi:hypothetical protein
MSKKPEAPQPEPQNKPEERFRVLLATVGSKSQDFNGLLSLQVLESTYLEADPKVSEVQIRAVAAALAGIKPADELEAMLGVQMIACHDAAMRCFKLAKLPDRTFEGLSEFLHQGSKLSRRHGAEARANHPRCRTAAADCTAENHPALPKVIEMHSGTAAIRQRPSLGDVRFRCCSATLVG